MKEAIGRLAEQAHPIFPITVYYAFKQSEMKGDGSTISTGWGDLSRRCDPLRLRHHRYLADAHRECQPSERHVFKRPRLQHRPRLPAPLPPILHRRPAATSSPPCARSFHRPSPTLQKSNIAPVDFAQAAIGPGMAIFTRYARVLEADGSPMPVRSALVEINRMLDETLARQEGRPGPGYPVLRRLVRSIWRRETAPMAKPKSCSAPRTPSFEGLQRAGVVVGGKGQGSAQAPRRTGPGLGSGDGPAHHRLGGRAAPDPLIDRRARRRGGRGGPPRARHGSGAGGKGPRARLSTIFAGRTQAGGRTRRTPTTSSSRPGRRSRRRLPGSRSACQSRRASGSPGETPRDEAWFPDDLWATISIVE